MQAQSPTIGIVGARGYSGMELARILLRHPLARLKACFGSPGPKGSNWQLSDYLPEPAAKAVPVLPYDRLLEESATLDTVFLATPAETSIELAPRLLALGANVIDLSGAFRLPLEQFKNWYGMEHAAAALIEKAQYGLVPWVGPASGAPALIANPGCYATSVLMGLVPLLKEGLIRPETLVIDSKSGASGAGRKAAENLLYTEVAEDCLPYRVGRHQHLPEIARYAQEFSGVAIDPMFVTHLLPVRRGILSGIYARLTAGAGLAEISACFERAYGSYPLLTHGPCDSAPQVSLHRVAGSARTQVAYSVQADKLYLFSAIDNLLKGAASQAVENFNRLKDFPSVTGLAQLEGHL